MSNPVKCVAPGGHWFSHVDGKCFYCGYYQQQGVIFPYAPAPTKDFQQEDEPEASGPDFSDSHEQIMAEGRQKIAYGGIDITLAERGDNYGPFLNLATTAQELKTIIKRARGWDGLSSDKQESLDMIMTKIARILNGNPEYVDNWHDIVGYAKLIEDTLEKK